MASGTRSGSDPHDRFYKHVVNIWLRAHPFITSALKAEKITSYLGLQVLLRDLDKVNSLKNEKGEEISVENATKLRAAMSLINEEQIKLGDIRTEGMVDFTGITDHEFDLYVMGGSPYQPYSPEALAKHEAAIAKREAEKEALRLETEMKQLAVDKAKFELTTLQAASQATSATTAGTATVPSATTAGSTIPTVPGTTGQMASQQVGTASNISGPQSSQGGVTPSNLSNLGNTSPGTTANVTTATAATSTTALSSGTGPNHELTRMQRASKPDPANVVIISSSADYPVWRLRLKNFANLHGFSMTLNHNYSPSTPDETAIFQHAQNAMFDVLDKQIQFVEGQEIVRQHLETANAQKVIEILDSKYLGTGSLPQKNSLEELRNFLSRPVRKGSLDKGLYPAIERWKTCYGRYNQLNGSTIDEETALMWLDNYLADVPQLEKVSDIGTAIEEILIGHVAQFGINLPSTGAIGLESVLRLHTHAAQKYDIRQKKKMTNQRDRLTDEIRSVNMVRHAYALDIDHELNDLLDDSVDNDQWYEIYLMKPKPQQGRIPHDVWSTLTSEERILWQDFSEGTKELILGCRSSKPLGIRSIPRHKGSALKSTTSPPQKGPINQHARVNLTDATALDATVGNTGADDIDRDAAQVHANVTNVRSFLSRQANAHAWQDSSMIDSARDTQIREMNQTSHRHPFDMTRFLSQPDVGGSGLQSPRVVNIHEDVDVGDVRYYDARSELK